MYGLFVQDDWRLTPTLKLLYGVRYDTYTARRRRVRTAVLDASHALPHRQEQLRSRASASCGRSATIAGRCCAATAA